MATPTNAVDKNSNENGDASIRLEILSQVSYNINADLIRRTRLRAHQ